MAVLSGPDFRFTLAPSDARVCILVPSSLRDESACEGLTQAKQVEHMETVARVRHDGWSYATTVASDCATARSFTPATAEKQFAAIAEGMRPSFGPGATMHTGDVTLANGTSVRDVYMTTIDVIFAPPRPAIADLVEHTRGYLFSAGSCTYAVSFTGGAAHAAQIDAEAADAIATLKATEPEANPHAAAYWAGYILAVMLVVIAVGWAFVAALRWKRPTNTE